MPENRYIFVLKQTHSRFALVNLLIRKLRFQFCNKEDDGESEHEEAVNVVSSFQRSVSMIGHMWSSCEETEHSSSPVPNKRYSAVFEQESKGFCNILEKAAETLMLHDSCS